VGKIDGHISMIKQLNFAALWIVVGIAPIAAQVNRESTCSGRVYTPKEVTKRARILEGPKLNIVHGLLKPGARARFVIDAVLCRSGQVTDIRVREGVSPEINEFAIAAVYLVKFEPAELRWHSVSQRMRFEIHFGPNEPGIKVVTSTDAAKRMIESVDIIGNRRLTTKEIFSWIQIRPGDPYNEEQLKRDFDALLATGYFDKTQTRAMIEDGVRGGVGVIFEVVELPVIGKVEFTGLKIDQSVVFELLKKEHVDLQPGTPYRVETVNQAARLIKRLLDANGQGESNVETHFEHVTAMTVNITFVIKPNQ
jgi:hypothetical protein